jgi:hypothetical protein
VSDLSADRVQSGLMEKWGTKKLLAADSTTFYKGAAVGFETTSGATQGRVVPCKAAADTTVVFIGYVNRAVTTTTSSYVEVNFVSDAPLELRRWDNASASISATSLGSVCYFASDHEVTLTSTNNPVAGRVYAYDSATDTVLVKPLDSSTYTAAGNIAANQVTPGTAYQALRTNSAGTASEWGRAVGGYATIDATNDVTVNMTAGTDQRSRRITACGDGKKVILSSTGAIAGDVMTIWRTAIGATTSTLIQNLTSGGTTLMTMTANKAATITVVFDGTDWNKVYFYQEA